MKGLFLLLVIGMLLISIAQTTFEDDMIALQAKMILQGQNLYAKYNQKNRCVQDRYLGNTYTVCTY